MNTLSYSDARRILAHCANTGGDILAATKQGLMFIEACWESDEEAYILGCNPDLVQALGNQTAQEFLGW